MNQTHMSWYVSMYALYTILASLLTVYHHENIGNLKWVEDKLDVCGCKNALISYVRCQVRVNCSCCWQSSGFIAKLNAASKTSRCILFRAGARIWNRFATISSTLGMQSRCSFGCLVMAESHRSVCLYDNMLYHQTCLFLSAQRCLISDFKESCYL